MTSTSGLSHLLMCEQGDGTDWEVGREHGKLMLC
jgi:hypothetical protein